MSPNNTNLDIDEHAIQQWIRRGGGLDLDAPAVVTLRRAWKRAEPLADHGNLHGDEIRIDPRENMVLVRCGRLIKTAIHGDTLDGAAARAAESARRRAGVVA